MREQEGDEESGQVQLVVVVMQKREKLKRLVGLSDPTFSPSLMSYRVF